MVAVRTPADQNQFCNTQFAAGGPDIDPKKQNEQIHVETAQGRDFINKQNSGNAPQRRQGLVILI